MKAARNDRRTRELARIHVGAKKLGMDRSTYKAFLLTTAGVQSAADLDQAGRTKVIERMHQLGLPKAEKPGRPHNMDQLSGEIEKIEAQLADMGLSWAYADAIARRMFGIQRVAWLRKGGQLRAVLAALHVEQEKRDLNASIDASLAALGRARADLAADPVFAGLPKSWERDRRVLRQVAAFLGAQMSPPVEGQPCAM